MAYSFAAADSNQSPPAPERVAGVIDPTSTTDFARYVNKTKVLFKGRDGYNREQHFIPYSDLDRYWGKSAARRIREVCKSYAYPIVAPPEAIRHAFLRVFSTLVYAGLLPFLPDFLENGLTDEHFPTTNVPAEWADFPLHRDMFDKFKTYQWIFFPVILDSNQLINRHIPRDRILPIFDRKVIRDSDATLIAKVEFHQACINLRHDPDSVDNVPSSTYIIKTYRGERHRQHYLDEFRAFNALQAENKDNHVVACYAAFRHGLDTYNLVLQYVRGCNLYDFLQTRAPPKCARDVLEFWSSLVKTLIGLHHLHQFSIQDAHGDPARYMYQLHVVHQDIKLDNILIEPTAGHGDGRQRDSAYSFVPFIADLGNSHVGRLDFHNVALPAVDQRGNQLYCAPEATRDAGSTWAGTSYLTWKADIFSMGAVLSDVATWVAFGQAGRQQYHRRRLEETNSVPGFRDSGYEGAFHNGAEPLDCVRATHDSIRKSLPTWDKVTSCVLDVVEGSMMTGRSDSRLEAKGLYYKLKNEIEKARAEQIAQAAGLSLIPMPSGNRLWPAASPVSTTPTLAPSVPGLMSMIQG